MRPVYRLGRDPRIIAAATTSTLSSLLSTEFLSGRTTDCSSNRRTREVRERERFHRQDRANPCVPVSSSTYTRIRGQARGCTRRRRRDRPASKVPLIRCRHPRGGFGRRGSAKQHRLSNTTPHRRQSPSRAQQASCRQRRPPQQRRPTQRRREFRQAQGADQGISQPSTYAQYDTARPSIGALTNQVTDSRLPRSVSSDSDRQGIASTGNCFQPTRRRCRQPRRRHRMLPASR